MSRREINGSEPCPCNSGKTYGRCCKKRAFKWERAPDGKPIRSLPLNKSLIDILKRQKAKFEDVFGRKPRKNDPLFSEGYFVSEKDLLRETLHALKAANVSPSIMYAYQKTGRIVTDPKLLTPEEEQEWDSAIDEFYERVEAGETPQEILEGDGLLLFMKEAVRHNQIVSGSFIRHHFNRYKNRRGANRNVEMVAAFATTNFTRGLKSIHILIENDVGYDAYNLLRALYENYLTMKYVYFRPADADIFAAQLGTILGTHTLKTNKAGIPIQSEIIDKTTGKVTVIPGRWKMALALGQMDQKIYNSVYRRLSSYCHSEITNIGHFLSDDGFDSLNPDFSLDALLTCHLLNVLFYSCLRAHSPCAQYLKRDLSMNIRRSLFVIRAAERTFADSDHGALPDIYEAVVEGVVSSDPYFQRLYNEIDRALAGS